MKIALLVLIFATSLVVAQDNPLVQLHDLLAGFFTGLRQDGSEIDKIPDPTQYIKRESLDDFVKALAALRDGGPRVDAFINVFQKFSVLLTQFQALLEKAGDVKDSQKLKDLGEMIRTGQIKKLIFELLTDVKFHGSLQSLVAAMKQSVAGELEWKQTGVKLGEFVYIVLSHVKPVPHSFAHLQEDSWPVTLHDIVKGFFDGLRKDGSVVDKIPDIGSILHRETLEAFVNAIQSLVRAPTDVSKWTDLFQKSSTMLVEVQKLVEAGGDVRDSKKLQNFMKMIKSGQLKQFLFGLLVDPAFHTEVKEVVAVFKTAQGGEVPWAAFGKKLGEFFHTILTHVN
jgi:hypothetical protein